MSSEQYPSISTVEPLLFQLMEKTLQEKANDDSTCKKVNKEIKSDLAGRYQDSAVQRVINVTAFLDPRYKKLPFLSVPEREAVMEQVEDEPIAMYTISRDDTEKNEPEESAEGETPMKQAKKGPVADLLGDLFAKTLYHNDLITVRKYEKSFSFTRQSSQLSWILILSSGDKTEDLSTPN